PPVTAPSRTKSTSTRATLAFWMSPLTPTRAAAVKRAPSEPTAAPIRVFTLRSLTIPVYPSPPAVTSGFAVSLWSGQRSSRVFSGNSGSGRSQSHGRDEDEGPADRRRGLAAPGALLIAGDGPDD